MRKMPQEAFAGAVYGYLSQRSFENDYSAFWNSSSRPDLTAHRMPFWRLLELAAGSRPE